MNIPSDNYPIIRPSPTPVKRFSLFPLTLRCPNPRCNWKVPENMPWEDGSSHCPSCGTTQRFVERFADTDALSEIKKTVKLCRRLSEVLFQEQKGTPQYEYALGTRDAMLWYYQKLLVRAHTINKAWGSTLDDGMVEAAVKRMASRVTTWKHDPALQSARGKKSGESRRRKTRGRDAQIVYLADQGVSHNDIAERFGMKRNGVRYVLDRDVESRVEARMARAAKRKPTIINFPSQQ